MSDIKLCTTSDLADRLDTVEHAIDDLQQQVEVMIELLERIVPMVNEDSQKDKVIAVLHNVINSSTTDNM